MAVVIIGKSECHICGKVLESSEDIVLFPPFIANMLDPLYIFNDAGVHMRCLEKHPLGQQALLYRDKDISATRPENRICSIGKNKIENPDDYIFLGLLTSDENHPLYKFNFTTIDRRNLNKWKNKEEFISCTLKFKESGCWKEFAGNKYLDRLLEKVRGL